jgi:hypothetical protein
MGGLTEAALDDAAKEAVVSATATSMGVTEDTVKFVGASFSVQARRALRATDVPLFATLYNCVATTQVDVPISTMGTTNATELYLTLTRNLNTAMSDGSFTSTMQEVALALNATVLASADATGVTNSAPTIENSVADDDSSGGGDSALTGGAIAGIVIGVLVGAALLGAVFYYCSINGGRKNHTPHEVFSSRSHIEIAL